MWRVPAWRDVRRVIFDLGCLGLGAALMVSEARGMARLPLMVFYLAVMITPGTVAGLLERSLISAAIGSSSSPPPAQPSPPASSSSSSPG